MKTVNSISGGRTSAYLAVHHPADYELFALVCNDDPNCRPQDPKLIQYASDKLGREFVGTPEHPSIIKIMKDLEQILGREIIWLRGDSFDELIEKKKALPNQNTRWCTTLMKLDPIFNFCYSRYEKVKMRVGFRFDEQERAERLTNTYKFPKSCNNFGQRLQNWEEVEWREPEYPLIEDRVTRLAVTEYWKGKLNFPPDSNCQMCFWKGEAQLRKNFDDAPNVMNWAKQKEEETGNRFKHKMNMKQIERLGIQEGFEFGGDAGCQAGYCTD